MAQVQASTRTVTSTESIELIRCLLRVSVYQVTALRGLFPDSYFREINMRNLEGMALKVLNPMDDESKRLIDWIDGGVFDAVKKGYLKSLVFGISSNCEGTELLEEYVYSFSYGPNGALAIKIDKLDTDVKGGHKVNAGSGEIEVPTTSGNNLTAVKYQVTRLMRMLVGICKTLEKVPKERYLFCRLTYYDHTPEDYEPSFFRSMDAAESGRFSRFARRPFTMSLGSLVTDHHQCALRVKSVLDACDDEGEGDDGEDEEQGSGQFMEEYLGISEDEKSPETIRQEHGSQGLKTAPPPRQRAQEDMNDLMTAPQDIPPLSDQNPQDPEVARGDYKGKENDEDAAQCPEAKAAMKASNALAAGMHELAVGKKRAPREPASENFPARSQGSDTTVSPSKTTVVTGGGRCSSKRALDAEMLDQHDVPLQPSQDQMNVYFDASQQSGKKTFKRSKASVVTDPIHQTGAKKKAVSPKNTPAGGRARLSRMRC